MSSLRWRLILLLWLALAAVGLCFSVLTYVQQGREANTLLDYQMEQIAGFLAARSFTGHTASTLAPRIPVAHDADDNFIVTVRADDGTLLFASEPRRPLPAAASLGFRTIRIGDHSYRLYSGRSNDRRILVAQQMESRREAAREAVLAATQPLLVLIPLLGLIIAFVVRRQLRPLREAAASVAARNELDLAALPVTGLPAEVRPFVDEINRLLERLRNGIDRERRFIADAAHALRTPLTALQLQADVLDGSPDPAQRTERLTELRTGIRRTSRLARHLLALARNESAEPVLPAGVQIASALGELVDTYRNLAAARGITLHLDGTAGATAGIEPHEFSTAVGNLLDNALRHSPPGATVTLRARSNAGGNVIEVLDEGSGLPEGECEKVVQRFYRVPGDMTEGSGLGLAVVKGLAERAGGTLELENRTDRSGLCARLRLPHAVVPAAGAKT